MMTASFSRRSPGLCPALSLCFTLQVVRSRRPTAFAVESPVRRPSLSCEDGSGAADGRGARESTHSRFRTNNPVCGAPPSCSTEDRT
jgi:hypothetical protein